MSAILWILVGGLASLALVATGRALDLERRAVGRHLLEQARERDGVYEVRDRDLVVRVRRVEDDPELWVISRIRGQACTVAELPPRQAAHVAGSWWTGRAP